MRFASSFAALGCGILFGFGLSASNMIRPEIVLDFLTFRDLGLLLVLGGAVAAASLAYQAGPRLLKKPWLEPAFGRHASALNARTLGGAAIFGAGWGLCGVCPGPAIAGIGAGNWPLLLALAGIFAGAYIHGRFFSGQ